MNQSLHTLLYGVAIRETAGPMDRQLSALSLDSRHQGSNWLFAALSGSQRDGHDFIPQALAGGATVVLCERLPEQTDRTITYVVVENSRRAIGLVAANFYDNPSTKLALTGITGTNGKTTVATLLHRLFRGLGYQAGLLSTVDNRIGDRVLNATHTTPDPISLQALLADMVEAGCSHVFMEVSSHAVHQERIAGLQFDVAVFTNLSHDHLDYHGSMSNYIAAKKQFFDELPKTAHALVNADDKRGPVMVQNTKAAVSTYAFRGPADFKGKLLESGFGGLHLLVDGKELHSLLIGEFNAYNLLAVYGSAILLGQEPLEVLREMSRLRSAEGRFDYVLSEKEKLVGIVDYAHTPDALEKVLSTIRSIRSGGERVITVVGCGGDRDRAKRPIMAKVACQLSEKVVLTADNPRSEDPQAILDEMLAGVELPFQSRVLTQPDRREAIRTACMLASPGDIVLVAGKGHEKYQEIAGVKHPFDDRVVLLETFQNLGR